MSGDSHALTVRGSAFGIDCMPDSVGVVLQAFDITLFGTVTTEDVTQDSPPAEVSPGNFVSQQLHRRQATVTRAEGTLAGAALDLLSESDIDVGITTESDLRVDVDCSQRLGCDGSVCNGTMWDGCNRETSRGEVCGDGQVCHDQRCCMPTTCADNARSCASYPDGCGVALACGGYDAGQNCSPDGTCCAPKSCDALGYECGLSFPDNCTGEIDCGACDSDAVCVQNHCQSKVAPASGDTLLVCHCSDGIEVDLCTEDACGVRESA